MTTKTGPIRRQIDPAKQYVSTKQKHAHNILSTDIPTELNELKQYLLDVRLARDDLASAAHRLQEKHDEWITMLQEAPDEQNFYDTACDEILALLYDSDFIQNRLNAHITERQAEIAQQEGTSGLNQTMQSTTAYVQSTSAKAFRAPKIKLPTFSGNYMEFRQFWGIFEANIHNRTDLTNIEKFHYLLTQIEGEARRSIVGVIVNEENYEVAVALLKSRFDRADDRIITLLYSEFHRMPTCGRKIADKQHTLDDCERIFRQLESAGEDVNSTRSLTVTLFSKFPIGMVKELQRFYHVSPNSTLKEVREALDKSIAEEELTSGVLDDLQAMKVSKDGNGPTNTPQKNNNATRYYNGQTNQDVPEDNGYNSKGAEGKVFYNSALPAVARTQRPPTGSRPQLITPPGTCYFCEGDHFNQACTVYPSAKERQQRLANVSRCTRCMKKHSYPTCPFPIHCIHCRSHGQHTSVLCEQQFPERSSVVITQGPSQPKPFTPSAPQSSQPVTSQGKSQNGGVTALNHTGVKPVLFQTAKTIAVNPITGQTCSVRLAMDTMSSRSYVREPIARQLGLMGDQSERLFVSVFGTAKSLEVPTSRVQFEVTLRNGGRMEIEANTTKVICQSGAVLNNWSEQEAKALSYYQPALADDPYDANGTIDVLVGAGLVWDIIEGSRVPTPAPGLFLIPSKFGLMLAGESQRNSDADEALPTMLCITESPCQFPSELGLISTDSKFETSYPDVDEFWNLEHIGITDDPTINDDDKALETFHKTVTFENDRYQVTWPWIEEKRALLPTNYDVAYDRFRSLVKRLKINPELLQGYRDIIKLQLDRGIIEEVPHDELESDNLIHYLPHHPVIKASSSTTKVRIVYDASAKKNRQSVSLNECMFRGPVILPDLCQLLMRMRVHKTVVISDIEKAFLQVGLQPHDRDVTRFLWFKDDENLTLKDNVKAFRFDRVSFGVISSPFLLAATIDHHLTKENSEFAETLRNDIYVDNVVTGLNDDDDPIAYYNQLKALFKRARMNIQEFCSNSSILMNYIPGHDKVKQTDVKVLGLRWDSENDDTLRLVPTNKLNIAANPTKRTVLQAIASIFDPLGFYQPVLLPAKCFLQKLWNLKYGWDDTLPKSLADEWTTLRECLAKVIEHRIPRYIGSIASECTLAVFSDASARAYATTVYLRCRQTDGSWTSQLIFTKSRLSPSGSKKDRTGSKITLPRLELLGAVIGVRAGRFCRDGLKIPQTKIDFFIDSQCVLHWINSRGLLKRFVANRVEEIRKSTNCEFHFVPTADNPADIGTRGKMPNELFSCKLWWHGPPWLQHDHSAWPTSDLPTLTDEKLRDIQTEIRPLYFEHTLTTTETEPNTHNFLTINPSDVSDLQKLIRVSVVCMKFLKRKLWRKLSAATQDSKPALKSLFNSFSDEATTSSDDYEAVKMQWVKCVQQNHYADVLEALNGTPARQRSAQLIQQLGLQLDHFGLIRTHGRYEHADLPQPTRDPLLIPKDDRFSTLVVADVHQRVMHSGVSHTLSQVRLEFWIPHGRALVRQVVNKCLLCRRFKTAKPFKLPPMPPWPKDRVSRSTPFESTGLDYFGPINVTVNETRSKMWVCLYTCLATRAVHLEPVMDFSAQEFLHCLLRFTSRRGVPKTIISDNAAQFQLVKIMGDQAWRRTPTDDSVTAYAAGHGVKWKFITELAPWQGGFYERLVGLVKSTLKTSIRRKLLTWTDFVTLLAETEAVVNSRPLTYINDDIRSSFRVIRPCDFLTPQQPTSFTSSPDGGEVSSREFGDAGKRLVSIWKQRCRTLDKLWTYWYEDYLLSLRERRTVSHKAGRSDVDKIPLLHQVILISNFDAPRGQWKLARITKLITGSDGRIRSAEVTMPNGIILRRALNHLVPLEVERVDTDENADPQTQTADDEANTDHDETDQPNETEEDQEFFGFSQQDVQRTLDALHRFDSPVTNGDSSA